MSVFLRDAAREQIGLVPGQLPNSFKHLCEITEPLDFNEQRSVAKFISEIARQTVSSSGCVMSLHDQKGRPGDVISSVGVDYATAQELTKSFADVGSETALYKVSTPQWQLVVLEVPDSRFCDPAGVGSARPSHVLHVILGLESEQSWLLSLVRNDPASPFNKADVEAIRKIVPLFERMLTRETPSYVLDIGCAGWQILDHFHVGVLLVGNDERVVAANQQAYRILQGHFGLKLLRGRLSLARSSDNGRLQRSLEDVAVGNSKARAIAVETEDGSGALQIRIIRLDTAKQKGSQGSTIAVFLSEAGALAKTDLTALQDVYGLTPIESQVVGLISQGHCPSEAAVQLGITVNTLRGYLKSIFRKTGVHKQTELIRLISACQFS